MDLSRVYPSLPFSIDISKVNEEELNRYLDTLESQFGGRYFRDRGLFMEVLSDLQKEVSDPMKFLTGPYVGLSLSHKGDMRIHCHKYTANSGITIYGFDQIMAWAEQPEVFLEKAMGGKLANHAMFSGYEP